ncbi:MAG: hypothetical protein BWX88_02023 [Planctomycetes bacterium ADurb.Bin126]|nr:MAG: hypothetical protein BWX88_02023 [Planctomycetes bacterium ADurb.Bin126]
MTDLRLVGKQNLEPLLSEDDVIDILGLRDRRSPKNALRWLMRMRRIGYVRKGRGVYGFRRADVEEFIARNTVTAAGQSGRDT